MSLVKGPIGVGKAGMIPFLCNCFHSAINDVIQRTGTQLISYQRVMEVQLVIICTSLKTTLVLAEIVISGAVVFVEQFTSDTCFPHQSASAQKLHADTETATVSCKNGEEDRMHFRQSITQLSPPGYPLPGSSLEDENPRGPNTKHCLLFPTLHHHEEEKILVKCSPRDNRGYPSERRVDRGEIHPSLYIPWISRGKNRLACDGAGQASALGR